MKRLSLILALLTGSAAAQEATATFGALDAAITLTIRSTTDIAVFGPVLDAFLDTRPDLSVTYEQWGSNNLFDVTLSDCRAETAAADVVLSSGVHQMVQLVNEACAQPYRSDLTAALPDALRWRDELWGISREPAVMVYNRETVPAEEVPRSRFDLLDLLRPEDTRYAGRVATYDIEASGLGYLFAFADSREATTFGALLESLGRTGAVATCCSAEIIRDVAEGRFLIAYNVLGSYALGYARDDPRIGVVLPQDYTLILSRALMIPRRAKHPGAATALLDFLLSGAGQAALRRALLITPTDTTDDAEGEAPDQSSLRPIALSPALLVAIDKQKREGFIRRWRDTFPGP